MLGKLTQETLGMMPSLGALTEEMLARVRALGSDPEVSYKGYRIRPTPKQVRGIGEWTLEVHIARDRGGELRDQLCNASNTLKTRDEAVGWAIRFGQDIIDGKVPGCSVATL
jgi:hypothetical protein